MVRAPGRATPPPTADKVVARRAALEGGPGMNPTCILRRTPGLDLERDVLAPKAFWPAISPALRRWPPELFAPGPMGLGRVWDARAAAPGAPEASDPEHVQDDHRVLAVAEEAGAGGDTLPAQPSRILSRRVLEARTSPRNQRAPARAASARPAVSRRSPDPACDAAGPWRWRPHARSDPGAENRSPAAARGPTADRGAEARERPGPQGARCQAGPRHERARCGVPQG